MDVGQALSCYIDGYFAYNGEQFDNIDAVDGSLTGIKLR
jgi:hypothetical protein